MLIEAARRAEAAAKEMLALVNGGSVSCAEMREALAVSKAITVVNSAFQTGAAASIAVRESHGDGGAEVLAGVAGLSRRDAHSQVKTARMIESAPAVRDAVQEGRVPIANAKRLAEAVEKTSADEVESDGDLLAKAESMRPEQFTKEARRWAADHQGDGEGDYRRQRAKRCVRIWDADDGMVRLHGEFDPVTGKRIANRLQAEARRLCDADKRDASKGNGGERRSFGQCMADALDNLTGSTSNPTGKPRADIALVAHVDEGTGRLIAELPSGERLPSAVLEEAFCNAEVTPVIFDTKGRPIWCGYAKRTATDAQFKLLIAQYGGCFACGANPAMCQPHHINPWARHGRTDINNLVPACWDCHNKIHYRGWQIVTRNGQHTLHPPDPVHYGPARAPERPPPLFRPDNRHGPDLPPALFEPDTATPPSGGPKEKQPDDPTARCGPSTHGAPASAGAGSPLTRSGPATARAALHNARSKRGGPPMEP